MAAFLNLARVRTSTVGTGASMVLGAAVSGFLTFSGSGAVDGSIYAYSIRDGANSEVGYGTYTAASNTLTRTVRSSTNGGSRISLSGSAEVVCTPAAEDLQSDIALADGTAALPALAFANDDDTGLYRLGANEVGFSVGGAGTGFGLSPTAFYPITNDAWSLGKSGNAVADAFFATGAVLDFGTANWVATHSSGILTVSTGDLRITTPGTNAASVATLNGTQTLVNKSLTAPAITGAPTAAGATWTDLGAVTTVDINGGTLDGTVIGGSSAAAITGTNITANTNFLPDTDGGAGLGIAGTGFSLLAMSPSSSINFANGTWVATQAGAVLTVNPGDIRITTAGTNAASVVTVGGTQTLAAKTLTSPVITTSPTAAGATWTDLGAVTTVDINGGTVDSLTSLSIRSTGAAFDLTFATAEAISAGRTLSWVMGNAARTITLSGNPTLNDWFDQSVKVAASPQFAAIELGHASANTLTASGGVLSIEGVALLSTATGQPLDGDLTAIAALTTTAAGRSVLTIADPNADRLVAWDDSDGAMEALALSDFTDEAAPAAGDYVIIYGAEGDLRKANWSTLPGAGGGISNVVEDTTPQLGGALDANAFSIGFDDNTGITDDSGNEQLWFQKTASAVTYLEITNAATGNSPSLAALGETNVDLLLLSNGSGLVKANGQAVITGGVHSLWIPAGSMKPKATAGAGAGTSTYDSGSNDVTLATIDFDTTTQEYAHSVPIGMPKSWDEGTVTAVFYWTNTGGASTETVRWSIAGGATSNDDTLNFTFGSAQTVDDTWLAQNDLHVTSATSAITIGGTPAAEDLVIFEISRVVGSDNMAGDARLIGVKIFYTINAPNDA